MSNYPLDEILLPMGGTSVKDPAKLEELFKSDDYIAEEKFDGSRYLDVGGRFFSRKVSVKDGFPVEKTDNVPHLVDVLKAYPLLILDGEVYIRGSKSNDVVSIMGASKEKALWRQGFGELAPYIINKKGKWRLDSSSEWVDVPKKEIAELVARKGELKPVDYMVYDILRDMDGNWLTSLPWEERRGILEEQLETILSDHPKAADHITLSKYVTGEDKKKFLEQIMEDGGEGVMLKNKQGLYFPDKKPRWNWVKVKQEITSDVIITGFKPAVREYDGDELDTWQYWENSQGELLNRPYQDTAVLLELGFTPVKKFYFMGWIGAIEFSQYNDQGELVEVGYCSGIKEELRKDMTENPGKYLGECMEIGAMERTKDNYFRHPQFKRMRPDKNQRDCIIGID